MGVPLSTPRGQAQGLLTPNNMILLRWMAVAMLMVPEATGTSFASGINAQGLLGSHFGIPALAGSFDYVVVGGGTGGLTVARRLAKDFSVAVIEAGDFFAFSNGNLSEVPAYATYFTGNDPVIKNANLDWYMYTEPQAVSCRSMQSPPSLAIYGEHVVVWMQLR